MKATRIVPTIDWNTGPIVSAKNDRRSRLVRLAAIPDSVLAMGPAHVKHWMSRTASLYAGESPQTMREIIDEARKELRKIDDRERKRRERLRESRLSERDHAYRGGSP